MTRSESPSIRVSRRGSARGDADCTVVWVRGDHDIATKAVLAAAVARAAQLDDVPLLVDLSAVTFMDASTVGLLVASRNRLRARGQSLEVRAPSALARRVLELCGLGHLVHGDPTRSAGVADALGTWVDVLPIQPVGLMSAAPVEVEEAATTVDANRAGP